MASDRQRRRQIIVEKGFQWRYAFAGALYITVIAICLSLPFAPLLNTMRSLLEGAPDDVVEMVHRQQRFSIMTFALCTAWLAAAWVLFAIRRSHKIAGPSHKMTQFMNGVTRESMSNRVTLRKGDELQSVADALNNMLDRLQSSGHAQTPSSQPASERAIKPPLQTDPVQR